MFYQVILLSMFISLMSNIANTVVIDQFKDSRKMATCIKELERANETLNNWSGTMQKMIPESAIANNDTNNNNILSEQDKIQKLVFRFGSDMNRKPIEQLVKDLVLIKRRSNRLALDIYLKTFDIRWPQKSIQIGVSVERVQKACLSNLDRQAMMVFNSPSSSSSVITNLNTGI